jgi:hypothetical protein
MIFNQSPAAINTASSLGVNTFVENGSDVSNKEFLDRLSENGLYGVFGADMEVVGHSHLLGLIHRDQPDGVLRLRQVEIVPDKALHINRSYPLERILDGDTDRGGILDPLEGAQFTIRVKAPVTAKSLAVWLDDYGSFSVAKEVEFLGDGKPILRAALEKRNGQQRFELEEPAVFRELGFRVASVYRGYSERAERSVDFGRLNEIVAYDPDGKEVPLHHIRRVSNIPPARVLVAYRWMKRANPDRPVFMTLSPAFMQASDDYDPLAKEQLYQLCVLLCDVAGVAFRQPADPTTVGAGVSELRTVAGPTRPVYAWMTLDGGGANLEPKRIRAGVWSALIRGATGIGYLTTSLAPSEEGAQLTVRLAAELKRLNGQLARLAPAILAASARPAIELQTEEDQACHFKATEWKGSIYIFAHRIDSGSSEEGPAEAPASSGPVKAVFRVEGLKAGARVEVVDENRVISADEGGFTDDFAPLTEHIYRCKL